jgi:hypothetical protein
MEDVKVDLPLNSNERYLYNINQRLTEILNYIKARDPLKTEAPCYAKIIEPPAPIPPIKRKGRPKKE